MKIDKVMVSIVVASVVWSTLLFMMFTAGDIGIWFFLVSVVLGGVAIGALHAFFRRSLENKVE